MLSMLIKKTYQHCYKIIFCSFLFLPQFVMAGDFFQSANSVMNNTLAMTMLFIMVILLLLIFVLSNVVRSAMDIYREKRKNSIAEKVSIIVFFFLCYSGEVAAQPVTVPADTIGGLSTTVFFIMAAVIFVELMVIFALLFQIRTLLGIKNKWIELIPQPSQEGSKKKSSVTWWERLNRLRPVDQEANIDLGHNYDGIRELDNRLPPWWLYGFYLTIIFAVVYLWRMHVTHTAPTSDVEYTIAMQEAEEQRQAFLKKTASNIDENSVKYMTAANDLEAGSKSFQMQCVACHGKSGEGGVGPNLTDPYWLHGGGIKEIFRSIKYGIPEKGMKKWSEDFSPSQIAQLASYVKSLQGTNPPNGKEKQGELYTEDNETTPDEATLNDSTKIGSR